MKKTSVITLLGILFCLLPLSVQAQLQEQRHNFALGVNGGVNLSKVSFSPTIKQGYLIGSDFRSDRTLYFRKILQHDLWYSG